MTVTIYEPETVGPHTVRVRWSSDLSDPTFLLYRDGTYMYLTKATEGLFSLYTGEQLILEILDDSTTIPESAYPGRLTLQWQKVANTKEYKLEEYYNAQWLHRDTVADVGDEYYQWTSRYLEDVTTHQFRVTAIGDNLNESTPLNITCLMVRHPDIPDVSYSWSDTTHTITVS